jgi:hypothetical protein
VLLLLLLLLQVRVVCEKFLILLQDVLLAVLQQLSLQLRLVLRANDAAVVGGC